MASRVARSCVGQSWVGRSWVAVWLAAAMMAVLLGGCAGLPPNEGRTRTTAITDNADTALGKALAPRLARNPGQSIFYPLGTGPDALAARLALARAATKSLDLQYYIFDADHTGKALIGDIIDAADRGVRVRILVDDLHADKSDKVWAAVDSHPNIEVRLFNPFAQRGGRWLQLLVDYGRLNRRMHNKQMTIDNLVTIVGGRNIGDAYFSARPDVDFSDLDVMVAGPVVPAVSATFDQYWNDESAYAVATLVPEGKEAPAELRAMRKQIQQEGEAARASPYVQELLDSGLAKGIEAGRLPGYVGGGSVIADRPEKIREDPDDASSHGSPQLRKLLEQAKSDLVLVSPYFVPNEDGIDWFKAQIQRGVHILVLTNSFEATDVAAVHAGYAPWRKKLLHAGVELYELKATAFGDLTRTTKKPRMFASSRASLHAKAYMVDRQRLYIGSLNLDPRSIRLNTEMGVVVESPTLSQRFADNMDKTLLDVAYKVGLRKDENGSETLTWTTREQGGAMVTVDKEPGMSAFQHIGVNLLRLLPIEDEL